MNKLLITPQAELDLESIYEYTFFMWGAAQADKYQDDLFDGMQRILTNRNLGERYEFSNLNYRNLSVNRHLIFYRIESKMYIIVRILHERTDLYKL